ncbi:NUDIX hydrolase 6-like protein [Tanacetum coccineum]|uniref:NUDIX hydrolase 6-like protein n=1 Tax=Tanacetum coccineum TaxID=301880 RepID=A0ABQ4YWL6_9ASTR
MEEINNFQQEPDETLYQAYERFKELLMKFPQHYLTEMQEAILFYNGLEVPTRQILDTKGAIPTKTAADAKVAIQEMAEYSQKWHNETSRTKRGGYRATTLGFYQRNNANSSYQERRQSMEETLSKFMGESAKRYEDNSNMIKEIQASIDAAIRNQGALIKTLEIQIGQISKVLQERGFGSLPCFTEMNPRDHVKPISTTVEADTNSIRRKKGSYGPQFLEAYSYEASHIDNSIPRKEKYPRSFTLPCYINNVCFDNALADLGASVSVMPLSIYLNLGLGEIAHTKLTVELVDRTVKYPKGIAKNVLVGIDPYVDEGMGEVVVGKPFCEVSYVETKRFDGIITIHDEDKSVTYQMVQTHPRFKHHTNEQCNKIPPLLKADPYLDTFYKSLYGVFQFMDTAYWSHDLAGKKSTLLAKYLQSGILSQ